MVADASGWSYLFANPVSGTVIAEFPLTNVNFGSSLNAAGSFNGQLLMSDSRVATANLGQFLQQGPGKTAIFVDYNGGIVWGGLLWTASYDSATRTATLGGKEFWSYFESMRRINTTVTFTNVDQLTVAETVIKTAQNNVLNPGGNLGVATLGSTSGQTVSATFFDYQLITIGQVFRQLAEQSGVLGFDYAIDCAYDTNRTPAKYLTLSYPYRGRTAVNSKLTVDLGASTTQWYRWPVDATPMGTTVYGIGGGSGASALRSTVVDTASVRGGYPMMEQTFSRGDIVNQSILASVTNSFNAQVKQPVTLPVIAVTPEADPPFGTYLIGDDIRVMGPPDEWFPNGVDVFKRIIQWSVYPPDQGVGRVELTLGIPPTFYTY